MNIGFPVQNSAPKELLLFDENLHSSKYFGVYCTESDQLKVISSDSFGDGLGLLQFLKDEKISSIISPECYTMAAKFFSDNQIGIYQAVNQHVLDNIEKLLDKTLSEFGSESAMKNSSCSSDCSDCSTKCDSVSQDVVQI